MCRDLQGFSFFTLPLDIPVFLKGEKSDSFGISSSRSSAKLWFSTCEPCPQNQVLISAGQTMDEIL